MEQGYLQRPRRDFPQERRDELWQAQKKIEKKRSSLAYYWLARFISPKWFYSHVRQVSDSAFNEYAKVLSPKELQEYFETLVSSWRKDAQKAPSCKTARKMIASRPTEDIDNIEF